MKSFSNFLFFGVFVTIFLQGPLVQQLAAQPGNNGMPPINMEELKEMEELLKTLDQDTLDALTKLGEEYMKEMEAQGLDPFKEVFGVSADEFGDAFKEEPVVTAEKPKEIKVPEAAPTEIKQYRELLKHIVDLIAAIRLKAEGERKYREQLNQWKYRLDDITYFVLALSEKKLLKYLTTEQEFEKLRKVITDFERELAYLEPLFVVPEVAVGKENPYTVLGIAHDASWQDVNSAYQRLYREKHPDTIKTELTKQGKRGQELEKELVAAKQEFEKLTESYNTILQNQQVQQAFDSILDSFFRAVHTNNFVAEAKKLFEKYEPEALKLKQEQEEHEKQARKEQEEITRRRPPYTPPVLGPMGFSEGPGLPTEDFFSGGGPTSAPSFDRPEVGRPGTLDRTQPTEPGKPPAAPGKSGDKKPATGKPGERRPEEGRPGAPSRRAPLKDPESHRVKKKLASIKKDFEGFVTEIDEKASAAAEEERYDSGKVLFRGFADYLKADYTPEQELRAKGINVRLATMTGKLGHINDLLEDPTLSTGEKKELRQHAKVTFDEYFDKEKGTHYKKIKGLFELKITEAVGEDGKKHYHAEKAGFHPAKIGMHFKPDEEQLDKLEKTKTGIKKTIGDVRAKAKVGPDQNILSNFFDQFYRLRAKTKQ